MLFFKEKSFWPLHKIFSFEMILQSKDAQFLCPGHVSEKMHTFCAISKKKGARRLRAKDSKKTETRKRAIQKIKRRNQKKCEKNNHAS